jgi:hypothetical protein
LEASPEARAFAAVSGRLDWETALRLALWASAGSDDASKAYAAVEAAVVELRSELAAAVDDGTKADQTLRFMHRRFLRAYVERQTRVDVAVVSGTFNCVSSAALYLVLGTAVGLDVSGVMTKDHAFCAVSAGGGTIDVETTSVYGFDPGSRKEFHDSFGRATGYAYVPPRNYRDRTAISRSELLSLILANRMTDLEQSGRFTEAVGLAVDRWTFLGEAGEARRGDLVDRLANYGASLAKAGNEAAALEWARRASAVFGGHRRWDDLTLSAANNLIVKFVRRGDTAGARAELSRYGALLNKSAYAELDRTVSDAELVSVAETASASGDASKLTALAAEFRASGALPAERVREIEVYAALKTAERAAGSAGWAAASAAIGQAIARLGSDRKLEEAARVYRGNRIAELHNAFAALFNAKRYADAREAAAAALAEFPDDRRLQADAVLADRAYGGKRP